ncbi:MAG: hypothetical protein WC197_09915, partial [Candidatus Gastranaerophilaceae bacterium]
NNLLGGCVPALSYKYLNGTDFRNYTTYGVPTLLTNDGMSYIIILYSKYCNYDASYPLETMSSPLYNFCGEFLVDVNGPNKGPSIVGRDLFDFYITKKGIYPRGAYPDNFGHNIYSECLIYGNGCATKVLLEGVMDY